jgi:hypothetical protein
LCYRAGLLRIDPEGQLTVFPVGMERVPRKWKPTHADRYSPAYDPDDPQATDPMLIEPPVQVMPRERAPQELVGESAKRRCPHDGRGHTLWA